MNNTWAGATWMTNKGSPFFGNRLSTKTAIGPFREAVPRSTAIGTTTFRTIVLLCLLSFCSACGLQIISGYDEEAKLEMLALAKEVDAFYIDILDAEPDEREYEYYGDDYRFVLVELNALRRSQEVRQYNELTLQQVDILLDLWKKDMAQHKKNDGFSTFLLKRHRDQYARIFAAMIKGEAAKAMATPTAAPKIQGF